MSSLLPLGNCGIHGYHGRVACPTCSSSAIPPALLVTESAPEEDGYAASLRADLERAHVALGGLQRDVERECMKSRPSKQRLREALDRSDLGRTARG